MEFSTIFGLIVALIGLLVGMMFKGVIFPLWPTLRLFSSFWSA